MQPSTRRFWSTLCFHLLTSFMEMLISFSSRTVAPAHSAKTTSKWFADHDYTCLINQPTCLTWTLYGIYEIFSREMRNIFQQTLNSVCLSLLNIVSFYHSVKCSVDLYIYHLLIVISVFLYTFCWLIYLSFNALIVLSINLSLFCLPIYWSFCQFTCTIWSFCQFTISVYPFICGLLCAVILLLSMHH